MFSRLAPDVNHLNTIDWICNLLLLFIFGIIAMGV